MEPASHESQILNALRRLTTRSGVEMITMRELASDLGAEPADLAPAVRELEAGGVLICAPMRGPVAVISLAPEHTE